MIRISFRTTGAMIDPAMLVFSAIAALTLFVSSPSHFLLPAALYTPLFILSLDSRFLQKRQRFLRRIWNVLSLLYLPVLVLDMSASGEVIGPVARLLYFLQLAKLYDRSTTRDRSQLFAVSFFQILAAAVLTTEATLLIGLVLFAAAALAVLMIMALLKDGGEGAAPAPVLKLTTAFTVSIFVLAIGIFFMIPRLSLGYLQRMQARDSMVSGFSDHMDLGQIGAIKKDSSVVMRIKRLDAHGPLSQTLYWRGIAYTTYDGRKWIRSTRALSLTRQSEARYPLNDPRPGAPTIELEFVVEPMDSEVVFLLGRPLEVEGRFFWLEMDENRTITSRYQRFYRMSYTERAELPLPPPSAPDRALPEGLDPYLELPPGTQRIESLAREITATASTRYDACRQIEAYLRRHYTYTLDLRRTGTGSPIDEFLFDQKRGHCEYFATSMALLCRATGVPARVVSGFLDGEFNSAGNFYVVRQQDAHAWVEAYIPGFRWVTFDPSPAIPTEQAGQSASLGTIIHNYWESYKLLWDRYILTYNLWDQFYVIMEVSQAMQHGREALSGFLSTLRNQSARAPGVPFVALIGAIAVGAVAVAAIRRKRRRLTPTNTLAPHSRRALSAMREYVRFLQAAAKHGYMKSDSDTPLEFARSFPSDRRLESTRLAEVYYSARFGDEPHEGVEEEIRELGRRILAE
ncbi:MAG: DUF3488 domain-containing protein [Acidobacteria bacterium]|nr:DUF3488 domain-containing protein [Acidobacteriota bacterium]